MIYHSVILKFKEEIDLSAKSKFFEAAEKLSQIEGVQKFALSRQTSLKNDFEYGISMEFETIELYNQYNNHPDHLDFIENFWFKNVAEFLEIDFEKLP